MAEVRSVIPVEETIIDPLYEPLKLNRYELCPHLQRLKDGSHVRHGFSPYLLFDVARMKEVVGVIKNGEEINNFFDYKGFIGKLKEYLEKLEELPRVTNKRRNEFYKDLKNIQAETKKIYDGIEDEYRKILNEFLDLPDMFNRENYKKIAHLFRLEYPVKVKCPLYEEAEEPNSDVKPYMFMCEEGKIYSIKEALLRTFELRRARWLYMSGSLHTVHRASTHTRLSHMIGSMVVAVNALYEIDVYPYGDMSMSLGEYLLMRGELHEFLMANFLHDLGHPPLSHVLEPSPFIELDHEEITRNLILGKKTKKRKCMDWYVTERYLLKMKAIKDFEFRFFENRYDPIYNIPDIPEIKKNGYFVFEMKQELRGELKDNAISSNLMEEFKKNNFLLSDNAQKNDTEISDGERTYSIKEDDGKLKVYKKTKNESEIFLDYLVKNDKILESEIVTVSEVLENFGIDKKRVIEILSGKVFCPICKNLAEINEGDVWCKKCKKSIKKDVEKEKHGKIYDIQFLNILIDSEIDFDRIDHVKRDSVVSGLSLISFRLLELLSTISIVLPESGSHKEIHKKEEENKPYIFISEDGLLYIMDLLTARKAMFKDILYSDENNWINGVVNQITALAVRYLPHLTNMLPFITDQILMHFYTNDLFHGTQIEKLNKLFHGEMDYSAYGKPYRYKLRDGVIVTEKNLQDIYRIVESINDKEKYLGLELPAVVFYMNIKPTKCPNPNCSKTETLRESKKMLCPSCKKELNAELKCKNKDCDRCERTINSEEAIKVLECEECGTFTIIIDPSEDLELLLECPFYNSNEEFCGGKMKKQKKNLFECDKCRKTICKLIDEGWDDIFVYEKKFKIDSDEKKYSKFKKLAGKYKDASRERFPERPSELNVKNLFYVWVSDFCDRSEIMEKIRMKIEKKGMKFDKAFVNLDVIER